MIFAASLLAAFALVAGPVVPGWSRRIRDIATAVREDLR
jgi:hypothetical protein